MDESAAKNSPQTKHYLFKCFSDPQINFLLSSVGLKGLGAERNVSGDDFVGFVDNKINLQNISNLYNFPPHVLFMSSQVNV